MTRKEVGIIKGIIVILVGILCGISLQWWIASREVPTSDSAQVARAVYYCPMHPDYTSDSAGECPICGMDLIVQELPSSHGLHENAAVEAVGESVVAVGDTHSSHAPRGETGEEDVQLTAEQERVLNIQHAEVQQKSIAGSVKTVGRVDFDETKLFHIHLKFTGYIEELFVNFEGQEVEKGAPLFSVYSPELYLSQNELVIAAKALQKSAQGNSANESARQLLESARKRLILWDVPEDSINSVIANSKPFRALTIRSPITGVVTSRNVSQGDRVSPEDVAYDVAQLATVWIQAALYESDLAAVRVGQQATFRLSQAPHTLFRSRLEFVAPVVKPSTRTAPARFLLANDDGLLKPGMFGEVVIETDVGVALVVPEDAVLNSGERHIVFLVHDGGKYERREVTVGRKQDGLVEVRSGLVAGQRVARNSLFMLDSESRIRASLKRHRH